MTYDTIDSDNPPAIILFDSSVDVMDFFDTFSLSSFSDSKLLLFELDTPG